jgi:hypothetical protein
MFQFHDIEQNSDEWFDMRGGRVTSSMLSKVMANYGKAFGDPAKKYAHQIAVEQITGVAVSGGYQNEAMERGHEEEPIARMLYEFETFTEVTNGGFFCTDTIGCSPDGLVGNDGVVEIKSAIASIHYERVRKSSFDSTYKWQLIGNMKFTSREWIDFISYCKDFPEGKRLYVYRLWAEQFSNEYSMIDERISDFLVLVDEAKTNINESNYINQAKAA